MVCRRFAGRCLTPTNFSSCSDMRHALSKPGLDLLNRRQFLRHAGTGLGAIALTSLLGQSAIGNPQSAKSPLSPRPPHFAPKAKRVLVIFCSGAVSHLDSWDYKPELIKRHGTPMPGAQKLITFQGEQGNLIQPLWRF